MSRMQAVILGVDAARENGDMTSYYCRECGHNKTPCEHLDAYFKSQVRLQEQSRRERFKNGERLLKEELRAIK